MTMVIMGVVTENQGAKNWAAPSRPFFAKVNDFIDTPSFPKESNDIKNKPKITTDSTDYIKDKSTQEISFLYTTAGSSQEQEVYAKELEARSTWI